MVSGTGEAGKQVRALTGYKVQDAAPPGQSGTQRMKHTWRSWPLGAGKEGKADTGKMNIHVSKCQVLEGMVQVFPHYISITRIKNDNNLNPKHINVFEEGKENNKHLEPAECINFM